MTVIGIVLWYIVGFASFTWWWVDALDFEVEDIFRSVLAAFLGPLWIVCIVYEYFLAKCSRVILIKRRVK